MLNYIRVDFSSDNFDEQQMMIRARRHLFRKLVAGGAYTRSQLYRKMRLLRSRMDPDKPCILMDVEQSALEEDRLVGRWQDSDHLLERELYQSFGGDVNGLPRPSPGDGGRKGLRAGGRPSGSGAGGR